MILLTGSVIEALPFVRLASLRIGGSGWFLRKSGFTFVEILLVVVLLGVVAGFALPNFSKAYAGLQLQNTASDMAYLMRYARGRAVIKQREVRLQFDDQFASYWLMQEMDRERKNGGKKYEEIAERRGRTFRVPSEIAFEPSRTFIDFYPDGRISKVRINICRDKACIIVAAQGRRGQVKVFDNVD